jgi:hypothetical protein
MKLGWSEPGPDDEEGPAQPGFAAFLSAHRQDRGEGRTLGQVLARAMRPDKPDEPPDLDEKAANMLARGYAPGAMSTLAARLAETQGELQAEREKLEADAKWNERVQRAHANGQMSATDIARSWAAREDGDPGRVAQLERRAASLRRQLADAAAVISPRERPADPIEAASRHAHREFVAATRAKMAAAAAGRPAPRPFASASPAGFAVRSEAAACEACTAIGATPEESFWIHHTDADGQPVASPGEAEVPSGQEAGRSGTSGNHVPMIAR